MEMNTKPVIKAASEIIKYPDMLHESGSIGFLEKIIIGNIIYMIKPKLVIETGLFKGYTHKYLTDFIALNEINGCRVVSFDLPDVVNSFKKNNSGYDKNGLIEVVGGKLPDSLLKFLSQTSETIDFAIVDSDHSYSGVLNDLNAIGPRLREGGYIFSHDYRPFDEKYFGTTRAIDEYCIKNDYDYLPLFSETDIVWGSALLRKSEKCRTRNNRLNQFRFSFKKFFKRLRLY